MSITSRIATCLPLLVLSTITFADGQVCDVDVDGDVDIIDVRSITDARNQSATGPDDPRDADGDGTITILDARVCTSMCTMPRCVEPPPNTAPIANAGNDQSVETGDTVTLDGSGSSDADGNPLLFSWQIVNLPATSSASLSDPAAVMPTFVADLPGDYVIELVVNDGRVDSAPDDVIVVTVPGNTPPVADAGPDQTIQLGTTVSLDGSASSDVDFDTLTFIWTLTSVPTGSAAALSDPADEMPTFFADLPGVYVAELVVDDGEAGSNPDTVTITTANSRPVADAGPDQTVDPGDLVQLNGDGSFDADNDPLTYSWSLTTVPAGSNAALGNSNTARPTFVADLSGIYVAQLIVDDGNTTSAPDTVVVDSEDRPPTAVAELRDAQGRPLANGQVAFGEDFILDASRSTDNGGGSIVSYLWTDLTTGTRAEVQTPRLSMSSFLNGDVTLPLGQHRFELVVTDDGGNASQPAIVTAVVIDVEAPTAVAEIRDAQGQPVANGQVAFGEGFILDASRSSDSGGGRIERYTWTETESGIEIVWSEPRLPSAVVFSAGIEQRLGQTRFELVVRDDSGNPSQPAIVTAVVIDVEAPTAVAEVRDAEGRPANGQVGFGEDFILDASRSTDAGGGSIDRYIWTEIESGIDIDWPLAQLPSAVVFSVGIEQRLGPMQFELVVVDDSANASQAEDLTVIVFDGQAPTAVAEVRDAQGQPVANGQVAFGEDFILDASRSADVGGGSIERYIWTEIESGIDIVWLQAQLPSVVVFSEGIEQRLGPIQFELVVVDDSGNVSQPVILTVTVIDITAPTAVLELRSAEGRPVSNGQVPEGENFILDASRSADSGGGSIVSYTWSVLDSSTKFSTTTASSSISIADLSFATRTAPSLGLNTYEVIARDDSGNASAPVTINVVVF